MIKIEDIWDRVVQQEPDDPPILIKVSDQIVALTIKQKLSSYKHRVLSKDEALKEALGEFKLVYSLDEKTLSISIEYEQGTTVEAEFA